jgi:hypothetical protein
VLSGLARVSVGGDPAPWSGLGFEVVDGRFRVGTVEIVVGDVESGTLAFRSDDGPAPAVELDGIRCDLEGPDPPEGEALHDNGVTSLDHLVIAAPSLDRLTAGLRTVGLEVKREREAGDIRQRFLRLGEVVLELVGPAAEPSPTPDVGEQPARLWGLAFTAPDLERVVREASIPMGEVHEAVQPGRRIVSVRREARLPLPVAFLTPA